jgi:hypothetical protein
MEDRDHLNFRNDKEIIKLLGKKSETLLLSRAVIKINRYGCSQDRNLLVTDKSIYNLKKKSKK